MPRGASKRAPQLFSPRHVPRCALQTRRPWLSIKLPIILALLSSIAVFFSYENVKTPRITVRWATCASSLVLRSYFKSLVQQTCSQKATPAIAIEKLLGSVVHANMSDSSSLPHAVAAAGSLQRDQASRLLFPLLHRSGPRSRTPELHARRQPAPRQSSRPTHRVRAALEPSGYPPTLSWCMSSRRPLAASTQSSSSHVLVTPADSCADWCCQMSSLCDD